MEDDFSEEFPWQSWPPNRGVGSSQPLTLLLLQSEPQVLQLPQEPQEPSIPVLGLQKETQMIKEFVKEVEVVEEVEIEVGDNLQSGAVY